MDSSPSRATSGALFATAAYLSWGIVPVYWKAIRFVPPIEVLAHRVIWSAMLLALLVTVLRRWGEVRAVVTSLKRVRLLLLSTALISTNWWLFIWAVQNGRLLDSSLGYYINPLVNVSIGVAFLGEKLRRLQIVAVVLAAIGVIVLTVSNGALPWISLALAGTFAGYGLLRKLAPVDSIVGLFVETSILLPVSLVYVFVRENSGIGTLSSATPGHAVLLASSGVITALPLIWFASAARRLPLSSLGFFQYISPTCQLVLAVVLYGEKLTRSSMVTFVLIWSALAVFSWEATMAARTRRLAEQAAGGAV